jgi:hypothetical protein
MEGGGGSFSRIASALQTESLGTFRCIERVVALGMTGTILETDSTTVTKGIMTTEHMGNFMSGTIHQIHGE